MFSNPGSRIRDGKKIQIRDAHPGSYSKSLVTIVWVKNTQFFVNSCMLRNQGSGANAFLILGSGNRDPGWTNTDSGSTRIRNPDTHIQYVTQKHVNFFVIYATSIQNVSLKIGWRWVAKLVTDLFATASLWVPIQTFLKDTNCAI